MGQSTIELPKLNNTRGMRNNNPGNLRISANKWINKVPKDKNTDGAFEQFTSMEYGIRAMMMDIRSDIKKGSNTIEKLINQYAPPHENNTGKYIATIADTLATTSTIPLDITNRKTIPAIAQGIIKVECGATYDFNSIKAVYDKHF